MRTFKEVIRLWPRISTLAEDVGEPYANVFQWYNRNSIPADHWGAVIASAKKRKIRGINMGLLYTLRKDNKTK